jgi:hypothetical protein
MKIVYFENSVNFLTNEDRELFRSIVGNDIDTIESAIKQESENLIQRIYSNEKYINNIRLNKMGLHVYRIILANRIYKTRTNISNDRSKLFDEQGYLLIENFLSDEEFANIKSTFDNHILPKYPNGVKKQVDASGFFNRNYNFYNLIMECSRVNHFSEDAPNNIPRTEFWNHFHEKGDIQYKLHTDTFQPTCKFWLYLEDVEMDQGPLSVVPRSHICDEKRLKWDFENSLLTRDSDGSFRVYDRSTTEQEEEEVKRLGYEPPLAMAGKKNTLLAANTFSLHKRGLGVEGSYRRTLTSQYRPVAFGVY